MMWFVLPFALVLSLVGEAASAAPEASLSPAASIPGDTVMITGKGFGPYKSTQQNRVLFNGLPALIQRWESEVISVKVPRRASSGPVIVIAGKKTIKVGIFTVHRPVIREVSPKEVEPGGVVQLSGTHFGSTAGPKDPNSMFGVNDVLVGGIPAKVLRWRDDLIEMEVPANAKSGDVVVRLASFDPLPDGSCCAPVEYTSSAPVTLSVIPSVRVDPQAGPVGTKVVLFGKGFGAERGPADAVLFKDRPATIAQWTDVLIVVHVPLGAETGPMVLKRGETQRALGTFTVPKPKATRLIPDRAPIGTLVRIIGENFGFYSESGSTPFAFADFDKGQNTVEFGGVPAVIYRWHHDRIDVWVPFSAKSGPVVVKRGAASPKPDGTCCAERGIVSTEAGPFTVTPMKVESYSPTSAGLDEVVTIKGSGFGNFLKTTEATQPGLNEGGHEGNPIRLGENVSRSEILFNNIAAIVVSWADEEIKVKVPHRLLFGIGTPGEFHPDLATGPLVVRRGSWDLLPDGSCCTPKKWESVEVGTFTIETKGLPEQTYFTDPRPDASTNQ